MFLHGRSQDQAEPLRRAGPSSTGAGSMTLWCGFSHMAANDTIIEQYGEAISVLFPVLGTSWFIYLVASPSIQL